MNNSGMVKLKESQGNGKEFQLLIKLADPYLPCSVVEVYHDLNQEEKEEEKKVDPFFLDFGPQPGTNQQCYLC